MTQPSPNVVNVQITTDKPRSYQYLGGTLAEVNMTTEQLLRAAPQYHAGPTGLYLWDESVNGAYQSYVADADLKSRRAVGPAGDFRAYGWYGDDYVLLSRNDSELYIMPLTADGQAAPQKITDYHRPPTQGN